MQIRPSDNFLDASCARARTDPAESRSVAHDAVAAELGSASAAVVQKALQSYQTDSAAVAQARRDILEGKLETPEAFDAAAENLLLYGI